MNSLKLAKHSTNGYVFTSRIPFLKDSSLSVVSDYFALYYIYNFSIKRSIHDEKKNGIINTDLHCSRPGHPGRDRSHIDPVGRGAIHQTFRHHFPQPDQVDRLSAGILLHYGRRRVHARHQESRRDRRKHCALLSVHHCFCGGDRPVFFERHEGHVPDPFDNRPELRAGSDQR